MAKRYYKRWNGIGDMDTKDIIRLCMKYADVLSAYSPDICFWTGYCLYGTPEKIRELDEAMNKKDVQWYNRKPRGAWPPIMAKISESGPITEESLQRKAVKA